MSPPLLPEYVPSDVDLLTERSNLNGLIIAGVAYGIVFTLFSQCVFMIASRDRRWMSKWVIYYAIALFVAATIGFAGNTLFVQMTYIDYRNIPGGPNVFTQTFYAHPVNMVANCAYVFISWIADGLLLYRFTVIYGSSVLFLALPGAVYLAIIAMSLSLLVATALPGAGFWQTQAVQFGVAYWGLSVALNVGITLAIAGRLLHMRSKHQGILSGSSNAFRPDTYTSVVAMLIESASLYAVWALLFIILYGKGSYVQNYILPSLGQVQSISSLLIIFRVSQGSAWDRTTINKLTTTGGTLDIKASNGTDMKGSTGSLATRFDEAKSSTHAFGA
ncbi:hypothetical protein BKA70DRAFT_1577693 [Coprinopsis sp. MPI-PUGE-AT-0042]|nr:hypothetical protein BKA70DRAFT_1577693 [Coprinopsis sp. MPI-PUGE-AT-0042]